MNLLTLLALELSLVCYIWLPPSAVPTILRSLAIGPLIVCILLLPLVSHRFSFGSIGEPFCSFALVWLPISSCFVLPLLAILALLLSKSVLSLVTDVCFASNRALATWASSWALLALGNGKLKNTTHVTSLKEEVLRPCCGITPRQIGSYHCARRIITVFAIGT